jgi:hypothetical protein
MQCRTAIAFEQIILIKIGHFTIHAVIAAAFSIISHHITANLNSAAQVVVAYPSAHVNQCIAAHRGIFYKCLPFYHSAIGKRTATKYCITFHMYATTDSRIAYDSSAVNTILPLSCALPIIMA